MKVYHHFFAPVQFEDEIRCHIREWGFPPPPFIWQHLRKEHVLIIYGFTKMKDIITCFPDATVEGETLKYILGAK